jgi:hypothetical protein
MSLIAGASPVGWVGANSAPTTNWIADTMTSIQNSKNSAGILGALQDAGSNDGSLSSFIGISSSFANDFATISQSNVTNASSFYAQIASQNLQNKSAEVLQKTMKVLTQSQHMVKSKNVLDSVIYFSDGTTIDTNANIMTRPDGTQYDITTGALYVDPASIIQMANGSYLDTKNNILTLADGTQVDTVTGLTISKTA